ncbi:hypothetical protein SH668x_000192 [Planctomicrobium sp. SH668]|uniref:hypothetical protein n=1 Tax=Planctomicrobium sp. SH668 TaxID=3448126 RepID=UPI003F5B46A0
MQYRRQIESLDRFRKRRGSALLLVLITVAMLSLGAYTFSRLMVTEYRAASAAGRHRATLAWAESGVEYVAALFAPDGGSTSANLYHNQALFHVQLADNGGFSVVSTLPDEDESATLRLGVMDESGKINLNAIAKLDPESNLARDVMLSVPYMTAELADTILDWIDEDEDAREYGAEADSDAIVPPRNGPIQALEELLLIPGVTPFLLYGEDANRNGVLNANENDGPLSFPSDNEDDLLDLGWQEYFTLTSKESNFQQLDGYLGEPRLDVNQDLLTELYDALEDRFGPEEALFITAMRLNGPYDPDNPLPASDSESGSGTGSGGGQGGGASGSGSSDSGSDGGNSDASVLLPSNDSSFQGLWNPTMKTSNTNSTGNASTDRALLTLATNVASSLASEDGAVTRGGMDISAGAKYTINSIYDLVGSQVSAKIDDVDTVLESPWQANAGDLLSDLPLLLDALTITKDEQIDGRININEARIEILRAIPGMPEGAAEKIVAARAGRLSGDTGSSDRFATAGWLVSDGIISIEEMRKLDRSVTARGGVIRIQVIGHSDQPGMTSRVEAVIDTTVAAPRVLFQRNLSDLGAGFSLNELPTFTAGNAVLPSNP